MFKQNNDSDKDENKDAITIVGGYPLYGELKIQGSKNAVLPIMAASLLIADDVTLSNVPDIQDVCLMKELIKCCGCIVDKKSRGEVNKESKWHLNAKNITAASLPSEYVSGMRSSILLLAPLLARCGEVKLCYPGGCVIGARPIDLHLNVLTRMGAEVHILNDCIQVKSVKLKGTEIHFPFVSVGATENAIMAATFAEGNTIIYNAAREPEIVALCDFLNMAGARITGIGSSILQIVPSKLHGLNFGVPADRIVTGTYMLGVVGTGGDCIFHGVPQKDVILLKALLKQMNHEGSVLLKEWKEDLQIQSLGKINPIPYIETSSYPGFPTDMHPLLASVLTKADGLSIIRETIFEERFGYIDELRKMGGNITHQDKCVLIRKSKKYQGTNVEAKDLRGGAALVIAGLMAEGITRIEGLHFIRRGYEDISRDVRLLGGKISETK